MFSDWIRGLRDPELLYKKLLVLVDQVEDSARTAFRASCHTVRSLAKIAYWALVGALGVTLFAAVAWVVLVLLKVNQPVPYQALAILIGLAWALFGTFVAFLVGAVEGLVRQFPRLEQILADTKESIVGWLRVPAWIAFVSLFLAVLMSRFPGLRTPDSFLVLLTMVLVFGLATFLGVCTVNLEWLRRVVVIQLGIAAVVLLVAPQFPEATAWIDRLNKIVVEKLLGMAAARPIPPFNPESPPPFFSGVTGKPLYWYSERPGGGFVLWDRSGFDPDTSERLLAVDTKSKREEIIAWFRRNPPPPHPLPPPLERSDDAVIWVVVGIVGIFVVVMAMRSIRRARTTNGSPTPPSEKSRPVGGTAAAPMPNIGSSGSMWEKAAETVMTQFRVVVLLALLAVVLHIWLLQRTTVTFDFVADEQPVGRQLGLTVFWNGKPITPGQRLPPGEGILRVESPNYESVQFSQNIKYGRLNHFGNLRLVRSEGFLEVVSPHRPVKFRVRRGDQTVGERTTPTEILNLPVDSYQIEAVYKNFYRTNRIEVTRGKTNSWTADFELGSISVNSSLSPASYVLRKNNDLVSSGQTPAQINDLPLGIYEVVAQHKSFTESERIALWKNRTTDVMIVFMLGSLDLTSTPAGAEYSLTGTRSDRGRTPTSIAELPVGEYQLTVRNGNWIASRKVHIKHGETNRQHVAFDEAESLDKAIRKLIQGRDYRRASEQLKTYLNQFGTNAASGLLATLYREYSSDVEKRIRSSLRANRLEEAQAQLDGYGVLFETTPEYVELESEIQTRSNVAVLTFHNPKDAVDNALRLVLAPVLGATEWIEVHIDRKKAATFPAAQQSRNVTVQAGSHTYEVYYVYRNALNLFMPERQLLKSGVVEVSKGSKTVIILGK